MPYIICIVQARRRVYKSDVYHLNLHMQSNELKLLDMLGEDKEFRHAVAGAKEMISLLI
ncbi:MAG: hypothetical protein QW050_02260 [Candidatus Nitrosocaldaceae archaeon]